MTRRVMIIRSDYVDDDEIQKIVNNAWMDVSEEDYLVLKHVRYPYRLVEYVAFEPEDPTSEFNQVLEKAREAKKQSDEYAAREAARLQKAAATRAANKKKQEKLKAEKEKKQLEALAKKHGILLPSISIS